MPAILAASSVCCASGDRRSLWRVTRWRMVAGICCYDCSFVLEFPAPVSLHEQPPSDEVLNHRHNKEQVALRALGNYLRELL